MERRSAARNSWRWPGSARANRRNKSCKRRKAWRKRAPQWCAAARSRRGIRTLEPVTRNTCDIAAMPALNELTHLPVVLDPSHATGKRSLVPALSRAGVAIGADGLIVEVHPAPEKAISDGAQSLDIAQFQKMMKDLEPYIQLWNQSRQTEIAAAASH